MILIDLGSTNGTSQWPRHHEQRLKAGDVVTICRSVMKVVDIGVARPRAQISAQAGGVDALAYHARCEIGRLLSG